MDISRRQLAGVILASAAVRPSAAQTPPRPQDELEAAKARERSRSQIIARVPLPMPTEPAFSFKA